MDASRLRETIVEMGRRRSLRDPFFAACEAMKLTPPQFHTLMWLGVDGALAMGELARRLGISDKTMTGLIDRLETGGYVQRIRDEGDRRVVRVKLSRKGVSTHQKLDAEIGTKMAMMLSLLDVEDRQALQRIFDKLLSRMTDPSTARLKAAGT